MFQGQLPDSNLPRHSAKLLSGGGDLAALLRAGGLSPVFQPIASPKSGAVYAHEALIRGPVNTAMRSPDALLKAATAENLSFDFENQCVVAALDQWGALQNPGRLFVNISAAVLEKVMRLCGPDALTEQVSGFGVLPRMLVLEITEHERVGTSDHLVRSVTETRVESARHANPLTFLPGNVPISQHITRLLSGGVEFVACYADLNDFKPFNDRYGYWRGDEMIRLLAKIILTHCDSQRDFVGHVGGDDFIMLLQSDDWHQRCEKIIAELADRARELFGADARERGGIEAEDRHGVVSFFPCTSLSIGVVAVKPGLFARVEEVASQAALAKHHAKSAQAGLYVWTSVGHSGV